MTNICAAIGLAQIEQAGGFIEKKRQVAAWYKHYLRDTPIEFHDAVGEVQHSYWMCSILVPDATDREPLRNALREHSIETRPVFYPVHSMPMYSQRFQRHPVAEDIAWRGINLPSYPALTEDSVKEICDVIANYFNK